MSDSEDSDFSDNQSERSSDGEAEEVEENEEEAGSPVGSDKVAEEEGEDLDDEDDYDEEEEEDDDDRPRKKPRHGGFILDEADVDDEYEDEEDQWEEGAEDILEKGEKLHLLRERHQSCVNTTLTLELFRHCWFHFLLCCETAVELFWCFESTNPSVSQKQIRYFSRLFSLTVVNSLWFLRTDCGSSGAFLSLFNANHPSNTSTWHAAVFQTCYGIFKCLLVSICFCCYFKGLECWLTIVIISWSYDTQSAQLGALEQFLSVSRLKSMPTCRSKSSLREKQSLTLEKLTGNKESLSNLQ